MKLYHGWHDQSHDRSASRTVCGPAIMRYWWHDWSHDHIRPVCNPCNLKLPIQSFEHGNRPCYDLLMRSPTIFKTSRTVGFFFQLSFCDPSFSMVVQSFKHDYRPYCDPICLCDHQRLLKSQSDWTTRFCNRKIFGEFICKRLVAKASYPTKQSDAPFGCCLHCSMSFCSSTTFTTALLIQ